MLLVVGFRFLFTSPSKNEVQSWTRNLRGNQGYLRFLQAELVFEGSSADDSPTNLSNESARK
jgi:hypothetical protein